MKDVINARKEFRDFRIEEVMSIRDDADAEHGAYCVLRVTYPGIRPQLRSVSFTLPQRQVRFRALLVLLSALFLRRIRTQQ